MHCVSAYPCESKLVNLSRISKLQSINKEVGLSDHSNGILSAIISFSMGVTLIEKHFTTDNKLPGRDNKFAILPKDLSQLVESANEFNLMRENKSKGNPANRESNLLRHKTLLRTSILSGKVEEKMK
jgi:sialic acid synthase SpsE